MQSSSPRCPAPDQLTAGILHTHSPSPHAARHRHPGPRRMRQARTSPASYLPWLSARPCWPRCFPAPLTVGGQRGSRPAGLSAPEVLPLLLPLLGLLPLLPEPGASSPPSLPHYSCSYPSEFHLCKEEPPPPLLPPSVSPLPPPSTVSPPPPTLRVSLSLHSPPLGLPRML